jgi:dTMP kinase
MTSDQSENSRFVTFEGGEGAGKSTQVALLAARLRALKHRVVTTREPGGSAGAEAIRALILDDALPRRDGLSDALLFAAARAEHLAATVRPALARGDWVLCDRFADSTRVYQGDAGWVPMDHVLALERMVVGTTRPMLTLIFDLPPETGLARVAQRGGANRFDREALAFHERLRAGFLQIAAAEPERCAVIDASGSAEAVAAAVWGVIMERLPGQLAAAGEP